MDDFGTGYSSLSQLRTFPVDVIKIDQSFTEGIVASAGDRALVQAINHFAASLDKAVVAEGVETHEQLEVLRRIGVATRPGQSRFDGRPPPTGSSTSWRRGAAVAHRASETIDSLRGRGAQDRLDHPSPAMAALRCLGESTRRQRVHRPGPTTEEDQLHDAEPVNAADPISNQRPVYPFEIPITALLKLAGVVFATVLVLMALARAQQLVGLVIAAGVLASLVSPLVTLLARAVGRVASTLLIHVVLLVAIAAGTGFVVQSVRTESAALEDYTVAQVQDIAGDDGSTFLSRTHLDDRLGNALETWGVGAVVGDGANSGAGGIAARAVATGPPRRVQHLLLCCRARHCCR